MPFTRYSVTLLTVGALASTGCQTDLTALNTNPNSPTTAPATSLFTNAVVTSVGRFAGNTLSSTSLFAQHIAQVQYVDEDRGHLRPGAMDAFFGAYAAELEDLEKVAAIGVESKSPNTTGPARVMQAWGFQNMTDAFGDIPYSEALKGDIVGGPTKPKYDAQKDIYPRPCTPISSPSFPAAATNVPPLFKNFKTSTFSSGDVLIPPPEKLIILIPSSFAYLIA